MRVLLVVASLVVLVRPAIADEDDGDEDEVTAKKPAEKPAGFDRPAPPHFAAFATAWTAARACLFGAPAWMHDPATARHVQRLLGGTSCARELAAARAAARDGDADAGYHLAWGHTVSLLDAFVDPSKIAALDTALHVAIGVPLPAEQLATPPALANKNLQPDSDGATGPFEDSNAWEHQITLTFTRAGAASELDMADADPASPFDDGWATKWRTSATTGGIVVTNAPLPEQTLAVNLPQEIHGAFGDGAERVIVFTDVASEIRIVRSHDAGAHWDEAHTETLKVPSYSTAPVVQKRIASSQIDVTWESPRVPKSDDMIRQWLVIDGTNPLAAPRDLGLGSFSHRCGTAAGLWFADDRDGVSHVMFADAHTSAPPRELGRLRSRDGYETLACSSDHVAVAVRDRDQGAIVGCDHERCGAPIAATGATKVLADITPRGELQYALAFSDRTDPKRELLVVGSSTRPPRVFRIDGTTVGAAGFHGGALNVVVANASGLFIDQVMP